jgi:hypothetical protein
MTTCNTSLLHHRQKNEKSSSVLFIPSTRSQCYGCGCHPIDAAVFPLYRSNQLGILFCCFSTINTSRQSQPIQLQQQVESPTRRESSTSLFNYYIIKNVPILTVVRCFYQWTTPHSSRLFVNWNGGCLRGRKTGPSQVERSRRYTPKEMGERDDNSFRY